MKGLHLAADLTLPPDAVTSTLIVYGGKGMGKTNLGTVFCEELSAANQRFSVIDPMGVFWGLRHSADGKGRGIELLILGGKYGDMPIEPTGGAVVADLVADESISVIIDISRKPDGKMWARGERTKFVADYCTRLYERQGERRRPLMQIIDEAGRFCPEQIRKDEVDVSRCLGAVASLVEEARNVGVGVTLITQRSARMSKAVSELADAMFAFRTVGPRSVDAILDWFGDHVPKERWKELIGQLRALPRGTALVVSPGWLEFEGQAAIRMRTTFDSSATPKAGKEQRASGSGAIPDLSRYAARMAETIDRAKADDPRELRRQIAELKKQIAKPPAAAPAPAAPAAATLRADLDKAATRGAMQMADQMSREFRAIISPARKGLLQVIATLRRAAAELEAVVPAEVIEFRATLKLPANPVADPPAARPMPPPVVRQPARPSPAANRAVDDKEPSAVSGASQRVLDALAEFAALGVDKPPRAQVAFMAGYTHLNSKGFANAIGAMRSAGYIDYPGAGTITLTEAGHAHASPAETPRTSRELQDKLIKMLGGANGRVIRELVSAYPDSLAREELAAKAGYGHVNSKGFANAIGRLRTLGFIDYPAQGRVIARPVLFLE